MTPDLYEYMTTYILVEIGIERLHFLKTKNKLTYQELDQLLYWIGIGAVDVVVAPDDFPFIGEIGDSIMLSVTLLEFPGYVAEHEAWRFN